MNFAIFLKIAVPMIAIFVKKFKNRINDEFVKIRKFILVIIVVISPQNDILCFKMKILKFFGMYPNYHSLIKAV